MNKEQLMEAVRRQMPPARWRHTVGVTETAIRLAGRYGADEDKAELAAILHDCCKYWPVDRQAATLKERIDEVPDDLRDVLDYDKELWHAPAGAIIASRDYGVNDSDVLNAIRYHTTGRERMTLLDKIVCLADYIEPGRDFPGVHIIRELAEYSIEQALVAGFDSTVRFLLEKGKKIYPLTVIARNSLLKELQGLRADAANP
jgi:predicted HD superfamily hydrolase involved in NAD metabolism